MEVNEKQIQITGICLYTKHKDPEKKLFTFRLVDGLKFMGISYHLQPLEEHLMKLHSLSLKDLLCCSSHF